MFGAPLKSFCSEEPAKEVPETKEVVEGFDNHEMKVTSETTVGDLCAMKDMNEQAVAMESAMEAEAEEKEMEAEAEEKEMEAEEEEKEMVEEPFANRVMFGKRFLSLDLALRAVLYALLFYIVSNKDTQALLKGVVKMLPKAVKGFFPMILFGVVYYLLNLFI